ncbi:MAG: SH3 domain-containing protein [Anaerolineales bacterium]
MARYTKIQLFVVLLMVTSLACGLPINLQDSNAISTSAAQTVIAGLTQNATLVSLNENAPTAAPTFTFTSEPPAITLTPTETTAPSPIPTSTSFVALISVSVPTNCRIGPGKVYPRQGALLVGETAEVFGRDPTNRYWYIRNPDKPNDYCWVWGEYATLTGPFALLPIFTPPPTPTPTFTPTPAPSFDLKATGMDSCGGAWWAEVEVKNTGAFVFKSMEYKVLDTVTDVEKTLIVNGFTNKDGCSSTIIKDTLAPNDLFVISGALFDATLQNHKLRVDVTLCTELNQKGVCASKRVNFTP